MRGDEARIRKEGFLQVKHPYRAGKRGKALIDPAVVGWRWNCGLERGLGVWKVRKFEFPGEKWNFISQKQRTLRKVSDSSRIFSSSNHPTDDLRLDYSIRKLLLSTFWSQIKIESIRVNEVSRAFFGHLWARLRRGNRLRRGSDKSDS